MPRINNFFKDKKADELINELGGVSATAKICKIATSSVVAWRRQGVPRARIMYLYLAYPDLKVWSKYGFNL